MAKETPSPREEYREQFKENWEQMERQLDQLLALRDSVQPGEKILLVGPNASGKSLFCKAMHQIPRLRGEKFVMLHASMALRTGNFAELGALSHMFADFLTGRSSTWDAPPTTSLGRTT